MVNTREYNKKRFSIFESEEKTALELMNELGQACNEVLDRADQVENLANENKNKKVSYDDLHTKYQLTTDGTNANFNGSWQGLNKPTLIQEGAFAQVEKNMADIIEINEQLEQKLNKDGIVTMANMGQDVKEAMTGGSVAVVGKNTVLTENIVDKQVTEEKTSFITNGVNLFNKDMTTDNKCIYGETGVFYTLENFFISEKIYIPTNTKIYKNSVYAYSFFDENNQFISGGETPSDKIITSPVNASYLIITAPISDKDNIIVCISDSEIAYEDYKKTISTYIDCFTSITRKSLLSDILENSYEWGSVVYKNLFTINKIFYPFKITSINDKTSLVLNSIFDVKLFNANKDEDYILATDGGFGLTTQFIILDSSNQVVCNYWVENLSISGVKTIRIDSFNNSGIYADITIDLDNIPKITGTDKFILHENTKRSSSEEDKDNYWVGKLWLCIGDSLTAQNLYQNKVKELVGFKNVVTQANAGFTLAQFMKNVTDTQIDNADFITIMLSMNDFGGNTPIGSLKDKTSGTFYGEIYLAIKRILERKNNVRLMFIIPHNPGQHDIYFNPINELNKAGEHYYYDYVEAVERSCKYYSIPYVNLYAECGLNEFNQSYFFNSSNDYVHGNEKLNEIHSRLIASKIKCL